MAAFPLPLSRQMDRLRNRLVLACAGLGGRGGSCYAGPGLRLTGPACLHLGHRVQIGRDCYISCQREGSRIELSDDVGIGDGVRLEAYGGTISLGRNSALLPRCIVYGHGGVLIGDDVYVAAGGVIVASNHAFDRTDLLIREQGDTAQGIVIESNCWLGAGVRVLDGVTIGCGSVIGAGSVVSRSIPPGSVAVGAPARVIRSRSGRQ